MKTFKDYIDVYGVGGWKVNNSALSPLAVMLKDELAVHGSTQFSALSLSQLQHMQKIVDQYPPQNSAQVLGQADFSSTLRFDEGNNAAIFSAAYAGITDYSFGGPYYTTQDSLIKNYGRVLFTHGETNNPFTLHTDSIENNGNVIKDVSITTDLYHLKSYYLGNANSTDDITLRSDVISSNEILQKMLELVIQYEIDTPQGVKAAYGNNVFAASSVNEAVASQVKLAPLSALTDPLMGDMQKAYIAYFGRPADPGGLQFWIDIIHKNGVNITDVVNSFGESAEYKALYDRSSSETIVTSLYQHLFNREPEQAGAVFWQNLLDSKTLSLSNIAFAIINGAQSTDAQIIKEKLAAATIFTASLDTQREVDLYCNYTSALNARKWLSTIDLDHNVNVQIIGIANDVINGLQGNVDPILSAHNLHAGFY
jgi:hypothetical protein